ncbi:hypothetical protein [Natribacillus halophilus]|uniref:Uncharacterized protein n=1 Tax=Natribacillus halophilus TaxID=549003 RepID=A0A1G8KLW2_9BACI|nr:hypothetical protein [Natribacillus halophilus]SDI44404.1 hypothetical protein SAMN04488123_102187 [Natribacillus halophilus]
MEAIILLLLFMLLLLFVAGITLYLLFAFGLFQLGKRNEVENAWLAFIPIAQYYTLGMVVWDRVPAGFRNVLPWLLIGLAAGQIPLMLMEVFFPPFAILSILLSFVTVGFVLYALFELFRKYSDKYVVLLVFSILTFGLVGVIATFVIRNNEVRPAASQGMRRDMEKNPNR